MLFFKLPFDDQIFTCDASSDKVAVSFHPFSEGPKLVFNGNIKKVSKAEFLNLNIDLSSLSELPLQADENEAEYCAKISEVISFVREKKLPKLVVSRRKTVPFVNHKISFPQTFLNLAKTYPNALVYFFIKANRFSDRPIRRLVYSKNVRELRRTEF